LTKGVSSRGLQRDSHQDTTSVHRGLRRIEIDACEVAGKWKRERHMNPNNRSVWARVVFTLLITGMVGLSLMSRASAQVVKDVGDAGKDAGKGVAKGGKDAGKGVGKGGEAAGKGVAKGGKDAGKGIGKGGEAAGKGVGKGGEAAGKGVGKGGEDAGKGVGKGGKDAGKGVAKGSKDVGKGIKRAVSPGGDSGDGAKN